MTNLEADDLAVRRDRGAPGGFLGAGKTGWLLLPVLFAALVYLPFLGSRAPLDGHEVLVAQTAREMLRDGDWVVPRFAGQVRLQKPPLAYWFAALSYHALGESNSFSARLPSALAAIALVALAAWTAGRWFGPCVGLTAGLVQASTVWSIYYGKLALVDVPLTLLVSVAILAATMDRTAPRWSVLAPLGFWGSCGLAVLAKGPVGLAVIFPTVLPYRLLRERQPTDRPLTICPLGLAGVALFLVLALGWPIAAQLREPAAWNLWRAQSLDRFLEHWGPNTRPWFYYLYQIPLLTLPWTPIWLFELARSIKVRFHGPDSLDRDGTRPIGPDEYRLLWLWALVAATFFTLSAGKRQHYMLPGLLPLSLLAAVGLVAWGKVWQPPVERWFGSARAGVVFFFACLLAFVAFFDGAVWPAFRGRAEDVSFFERNQAVLEAAQRVIQFGSNDRWTAFLVDRPMEFARSESELKSAVGDGSGVVVLADRRRAALALDCLPGEWISTESATPNGPPTRSTLVLLRPAVMR